MNVVRGSLPAAALALVLFALGSALPNGRAAQGAAPAGHPNIVFLLADDLGWKDVGYHGSEIKTPNIDRLAREGVVLEQCYAMPVCSPARSSAIAICNFIASTSI